MNKKLLILVAVILVALPIISGCALRVAGDVARSAPDIPHAVDDVRYNNCLVCHALDMWRTEDTAKDHVYEGYTNKDCSRDETCHARPDGSFSTP
ncbi:MAG: hypothetical protein FWF98_03330 [Dehalococcoidia bacterium]|nr:hypothetical protein [Dehalococcoidia bacterium]